MTNVSSPINGYRVKSRHGSFPTCDIVVWQTVLIFQGLISNNLYPSNGEWNLSTINNFRDRKVTLPNSTLLIYVEHPEWISKGREIALLFQILAPKGRILILNSEQRGSICFKNAYFGLTDYPLGGWSGGDVQDLKFYQSNIHAALQIPPPTNSVARLKQCERACKIRVTLLQRGSLSGMYESLNRRWTNIEEIASFLKADSRFEVVIAYPGDMTMLAGQFGKQDRHFDWRVWCYHGSLYAFASRSSFYLHLALYVQSRFERH
jgi:hypothetical protein